ncbi:hypothetical protein OXYTRIMIC_303 [Oxytricha trifallax]|uniref:Uncharacterized protein n=1 Tax=Oxytricha trifallax TaxID=1172189 RepID=A0A073HZA3_9SPIT|nr:hypothetical protein OXYTRIMIC_303 [Oxytricha trifallax]
MILGRKCELKVAMKLLKKENDEVMKLIQSGLNIDRDKEEKKDEEEDEPDLEQLNAKLSGIFRLMVKVRKTLQ